MTKVPWIVRGDLLIVAFILGVLFSPVGYSTGFERGTAVMPAKAGIQEERASAFRYSTWIPAFAGMTNPQVKDGRIETPLTNQPGDPDRGRSIVLDRERGDCVVCHAMPLPERQFHGTVGPPLDGVGKRYSAGALRLRLADSKEINPYTIMPAYHKVAGLNRVAERYRGKPILTAQEIEDVVAYLLTLK